MVLLLSDISVVNFGTETAKIFCSRVGEMKGVAVDLRYISVIPVGMPRGLCHEYTSLG